MGLFEALGIAGKAGEKRRETRGDTKTVRKIVRKLEALPPERARYLAAFAYVLTRVANADRRFLQLHFCTSDPAAHWDEGYGRFGVELEATGLATHLWSAPFIQTVVGTDTYTDQLW